MTACPLMLALNKLISLLFQNVTVLWVPRLRIKIIAHKESSKSNFHANSYELPVELQKDLQY